MRPSIHAPHQHLALPQAERVEQAATVTVAVAAVAVALSISVAIAVITVTVAIAVLALAIIAVVPLVLAVVVMGAMFRNTDDLMERANQSITTLNSVMIEYIGGMKLIKAYNMGSKSFQKFSDAIQEENAMWNETSRRMGPPYAAFVVIIECGMLLMVPIGGMFFLKGSLAASAFLLFVYVGSMYLTEIRPLQELGTNFANVLNAVTKTKEILDIPIYEGGTDFPQNHDIELRNVRFSYDGKTDVLQGVNLKINDGERVALVGQSGAGKSTVIELISRFYDVQEGEVLIGGKNVKELDYDTILKNVAIVFQKTFLTRDSVLENIRMGSNATLEEVRAAAKEAQIDDFIMSLPDGYDTKVGSFGSRFSGGEKQRIAIARAILKNAPILILDEATTGLDPVVRDEVLDLFWEFIQDEDCSIFFSSHITSDIQKIADYVILIHQGKIIFEEQKDNLVYNYGVVKCGKEKFAQLSADDYIIHRTTNMSVECLVHDKEAFKRKYKNIIVDNATLEDIMLFYVKGGTSCED